MSNSGILTKSNSRKLENAIILSRNEVVQLRRQKISNWPEKTQILALKYGIPFLSVSNLLTNTWINSMYRKRFNLKYGGSVGAFLSSILLTGVFPTATDGALLTIYYTDFLFYSLPTECLICREIKSIGLHLIVGSIIPAFLAWKTNYFQAGIYKTYSLPDNKWLLEKKYLPKYWYFFKRVFKDTTKNSFSRIYLSLSIQIILSSAVFFLQQKEYYEHIEPQKISLTEIKKIKSI